MINEIKEIFLQVFPVILTVIGIRATTHFMINAVRGDSLFPESDKPLTHDETCKPDEFSDDESEPIGFVIKKF